MYKKSIILLILVLVLIMPAYAANDLETQVNHLNMVSTDAHVIFMGSFFDPGTITGGNLLGNQYMKEYLPGTDLTRNTVKLCMLGTPMIIFGNGSSPIVMVVAGVHGDELPAQIASVKLINYLKDKKINGTIIVVPSVSPASTNKNQRYWNYQNLNRVANEPGTPTFTLLETARNLKVEILGDFHSTQPGGDPGRNSVFCSKNPTHESYDLAVYISKQTQSDLITFEDCESEYSGAVENNANLQGMVAVTCEVLSPHGMANNETIEKSYTQMITFLKYKNVL